MNAVSPKLVKARYCAVVPFLVVSLLGSAASAVFLWSWMWIVAGVWVAILGWAVWLIPAQVRRIGWREDTDELLITKGKLWRTLTVVPYGRLQFVDVQEGPIARRCGLAEVEIHTASSTSDASIAGLPVADAYALRQRLTDKARERLSGL
ncbi:PH domain-containing protein [Corynebacterium belfantii]|uniref:PH domain-containing protein n=1 Tax=Corynebacterium belfantii TaxID=2014537 RepID=UPI0018CB3CF2|nr:PH domain-containing protein [Corynebacterium belfantii]MBG9288046.1 PH domain-containing protein [Corynebacterium belfantii]